jgi:hypothetical protein
MYTCIENLTQTRDYIVPVLRGGPNICTHIIKEVEQIRW